MSEKNRGIPTMELCPDALGVFENISDIAQPISDRRKRIVSLRAFLCIYPDGELRPETMAKIEGEIAELEKMEKENPGMKKENPLNFFR